MPEVVEVEIMAQNMARWLVGAALRRVEVLEATWLHPGEAEVRAAIGVGGVRAVWRHGKAALLQTGEGVGLLVRMGMTGLVVLEHAPRPWGRLRLVRAEGPPVLFLDPRKLGGITAVRWEGEPSAALASWIRGRDALREPPDAQAWMDLTRGVRRPIKDLMMDQHTIAGLGNIYAAEVLFEAGILPVRPAGGLSYDECEALARVLPGVLARALEADQGEEIHLVSGGEVPPHFRVYRRGGQPCGRCGQALQREVLSGRGTWFCRGCQS